MSTKAKHQRGMLSATKQTISIKLATTVGHFCVTLTMFLQTFICLVDLVFSLLQQPLTYGELEPTSDLSKETVGRYKHDASFPLENGLRWLS